MSFQKTGLFLIKLSMTQTTRVLLQFANNKKPINFVQTNKRNKFREKTRTYSAPKSTWRKYHTFKWLPDEFVSGTNDIFDKAFLVSKSQSQLLIIHFERINTLDSCRYSLESNLRMNKRTNCSVECPHASLWYANLPNNWPMVITKIPLAIIFNPNAPANLSSLAYSDIVRFWLTTVAART